MLKVLHLCPVTFSSCMMWKRWKDVLLYIQEAVIILLRDWLTHLSLNYSLLWLWRSTNDCGKNDIEKMVYKCVSVTKKPKKLDYCVKSVWLLSFCQECKKHQEKSIESSRLKAKGRDSGTLYHHTHIPGLQTTVSTKWKQFCSVTA